MKNREWIIKHNIYDTLIMMQKHRGFCVIEDLTGHMKKGCICQSNSLYDSCEECIQDWLNQECDIDG